jgi:hypothetical protein
MKHFITTYVITMAQLFWIVYNDGSSPEIMAEGVWFSSGKVCLNRMIDKSTIVMYEFMSDLQRYECKDDFTKIVFIKP